MEYYEKKYKEAVERAKKLIETSVAYDRFTIEKIFPELKEFDSEKIRGAIIHFISHTPTVPKGIIGKETMITWLEGLGDKDKLIQELGEYKVKYTQKVLENIISNKDDESIRKELITHCRNTRCVTEEGAEKITKWITWLEKQGNNCLVNSDEAEKEKYDFVSGQFIECRKSFNEFKEGNSYWLEYVGNDTYIGRSDNILNQKFHITPRQLYRLFTQQHCPKEDSDETNAPTEYGKYVDECLNEASKHFFSEGEDKYNVADLFYAGVRCGKSWIEKQGEQKYENANIANTDKVEPKDYNSIDPHFSKPIDKVEPKFHKGDWIISHYSHIAYIKSIDEKYYILSCDNGSCERLSIEYIDRNWHLWTILDAKAGDVLISRYNKPFIYNGNWDSLNIGSYCGITLEGIFSVATEKCFWTGNENIHPATKEQREQLEKAMTDAGYIFDFDKKELNKIEQKPTPKFHKGDWIVHQGTENIYQVVAIIDNQYHLMYGNIYTIQKCADVDRYARLWTIDDAKDGSILACENGWTCIFKALDNHTNTFSSYCFMDADGWFYEDGGEGHTLDNRFCGEIYPATEERRDKFEKAMADAGYEWNAEKKELKKIVQKPTDEEMKELLRTEYEKGRADTIAEMQVTWSEEDEKHLSWLIEHLGQSAGLYDNLIDWIKSLKPQPQWKPSNEQLEAFEHFVRCIGESGYDNKTKLLHSLLSDLKKLT